MFFTENKLLARISELDSYRYLNRHAIGTWKVKEAEDGEGFILRLHDHTGSKRQIILSPTFKFTSWCETSLMKTPTHDMIECTSGDIQLELTPFEVKTILIK